MEKYLEIIRKSYSGYWNYLKNELISINHWDNYFYGLILISIVVWLLEIAFPWRKEQSIFRKDFWLDTFYMFFNFFLLNLIILIALSNTAATFFNDILSLVGLQVSSFQLFDVDDMPKVIGLFIFFIISDFVQWNTHRLLHRVPWLWNFHKVHHSVKEMGFAAHLRYHWMEPIVYKSLLYIPIAIIGGFDAQDVAIVHFFSITIGHLNHANLGWNYGFLKYIFNNPKMHIWHHAKELPQGVKYGVNYGLTLSIWDYIFKTDYIPFDGRDIELGFENDEKFPKDFFSQELYPLKFKKKMKLPNIFFFLFVCFSLSNCFSAKGLPIKEVKEETQQNQDTTPATSETTPIVEQIEDNVIVEDVKIDSLKGMPKVNHSEWDKLVKKYVVDNGDIDYNGFKKDLQTLNNYVAYLATQVPSESWSLNEQLAYFINVYNANTIKLIADNYPIKSIKDIKNPWLKNRIKIGGKDFSLADIENGILRKTNEPRIHFVINCASFSCPKLLNTAYTETNVQELMELATREFINNTSKNKIGKAEIKISEIFKWYKSDFTENGSVIDYINQYSNIKILPNAKIDYIDYNWSLNEKN